MDLRNSPEDIGNEILLFARSQLLVNFRFLDRALLSMDFMVKEETSLITDGFAIYYDPWYIAHRYKSDEYAVNRDLLHLLLHLIFHHGYVGKEINQPLWSLAADMAVEAIISDLNKPFLSAKRVQDQKDIWDQVLPHIKEGKPLSAEVLFDTLEQMELKEEVVDTWRQAFWGDSHQLWYAEMEGNDHAMEIQVRWEDISKRMQVELELVEQREASLLARQLRQFHKVKQNYSEFLRKFCSHEEVLKLSDEEFDYNYYTYGLRTYGNIPIVEPLEYSEDAKLREFVIAIDTSGSISPEVAEKFISHTYDMLSKEDRFSRHCCIHIVQCDDKVEEVAILHSKEDLEHYIHSMTIKGLGETDFRPVFSYVAECQQKGELRHLKGLLYFTDGDGIFPSTAPRYDVAFILHQDKQYTPAPVPIWAMKLELEDEDILRGRL